MPDTPQSLELVGCNSLGLLRTLEPAPPPPPPQPGLPAANWEPFVVNPNSCSFYSHSPFAGLRTNRQGVIQPVTAQDASQALRELSDRYSGEQTRHCFNTPQSPQRYLQIGGVAVDNTEMPQLRERYFSGGPQGNLLERVIFCSDANVAGTPGFNVTESGDLRRGILQLGGLALNERRPLYEIGLARMVQYCAGQVLHGDDASARCETVLTRLIDEAMRLEPTNRQFLLESPNTCGGNMYVIPGTTFTERDLDLLRGRLRLGSSELMFNRSASAPGQACIAGHGSAHLQWMINQLSPCPVEQGLCQAVETTLRGALPPERSWWTEILVAGFLTFGIAAPLGAVLVHVLTRRIVARLENTPATQRPGEPVNRSNNNDDDPPPAGPRPAGAAEGVDAAAEPIEAEPLPEETPGGNNARRTFIAEAVGGGDGAGVRILHGDFDPAPPSPAPARPPLMPDYARREYRPGLYLFGATAAAGVILLTDGAALPVLLRAAQAAH